MLASATTPSPDLSSVLTSQAAVALWLRFQCNAAATLHESYREVLLTEAKHQGRKIKRDKKQNIKKQDIKIEDSVEDSAEDSIWLEHLWGTALLSRFVHERFALRIDAWPRQPSSSSSPSSSPSDLPFFLRLVMLDSPVLLRLLRSAGLVLSASLIASVIESDQVARLREGLGEENYTFALTKGMRLRPASSRVSLTLASEQRTSLGDAAFHTVLGLRLLMRQAEGSFSEQHWRRLALKCPRGIVDLLRRNSEQEMLKATHLDAGTAAGLHASLTMFEPPLFEAEAEEDMFQAKTRQWWCAVAKEVVGSWHAWLESSKVA